MYVVDYKKFLGIQNSCMPKILNEGGDLMDFYPVAIEKLIEEFAKLPSIGQKTAQRLALHVLKFTKR